MTPIISEGYPFIGACFFLALLVGFSISPYAAVIPLVLMFYFCYFFRNPKREITQDEDVILSPADGTVTDIVPMETDEFVKEPCNKVIIFMSVFNVHVNRSPIRGKIKLQKYFCGRFRPAYKDTVGFENEHHVLGIENDRMKILVIQIAGILARRIDNWVNLGNHLDQGEVYGMIKFGSCTELVVPVDVEILCKKGDKVKGGITVLGRTNA